MKKIITATVATVLAMLAAAPLADARPYRGAVPSSHIYISSYRSCGTPVYTERYFIRHDRRGYPVWGYRTVAYRTHHYRSHRPAPRYHHVPVCPPPVRYHRSRY
jgi:hypothetical protein